VVAEAFGDRLVEVLDLAVEIEQLGRDPFDQSGGTGFAAQRQVLCGRQGHGGGRGRGDPWCPRLVGGQVSRDALGAGGSDLCRGAQSADQDQWCAGGVVERRFQSGEDRAQQ
jgi:hypothetical protein